MIPTDRLGLYLGFWLCAENRTKWVQRPKCVTEINIGRMDVWSKYPNISEWLKNSESRIAQVGKRFQINLVFPLLYVYHFFLFYFPSAGSQGWCSSAWGWPCPAALGVTARTGGSLTCNCPGQIRPESGKINIIYCQMKEIWIVRNRDKIKTPPASAPLLSFLGSASLLPAKLFCPPQPQPGAPPGSVLSGLLFCFHSCLPSCFSSPLPSARQFFLSQMCPPGVLRAQLCPVLGQLCKWQCQPLGTEHWSALH